jgi:hypothetical protein
MKTEIITGVEMDPKGFNIKIIPHGEYIKRKEEFELEQKKYISKTPVAN